jgi:hypothetical protein
MSLETEKNIMDFLVSSEGWRLYEAYLKARFDALYKRLRKSNRDSAFYKIQGGLDEIEYALKLPQTIVDRGELAQPTQ